MAWFSHGILFNVDMARLLVIVGAGASFDCASDKVFKDPDLRPPLVTELFASRLEFSSVLRSYPLAQAAAADIRPTIESGSVAIEEFLRERLCNSNDTYARRRYRQVPLYLQELLHRVSNTRGSGYTSHPDNYDALLNATLALEEVVFISLNYDTLLDQSLSNYEPLDSKTSYLGLKRNWSLIKLHGSVNWGRKIMNDALRKRTTLESEEFAHAIDKVHDDLVLDPNIIIHIPESRLTSIRHDQDGAYYYPALSVPLGSADEVACPDEHLAHLRDRLKDFQPLNILVIGYSGLDEEVRRHLSGISQPTIDLRIVNGNADAGEAAYRRLEADINPRGLLTDPVFSGGFTEFVLSGELADFIAHLR
jgi:hypothetical protein